MRCRSACAEPVTAIATVVESPAAVPHDAADGRGGDVDRQREGAGGAVDRGERDDRCGRVDRDRLGAGVAGVAAASVCVAVIEYAPSADSAVVGVKVQVPAVQVAVPFWVLARR